MANAFIWSAFEYFLRQDTDSYIVFSPVKYYKSQHLIHKKFIDGYAFNRRHFHTSTDACIMCAYWSNETDKNSRKVALKAINLDAEKKYVDEGLLDVKQVFNMFSNKYYDNRIDTNDTDDGILCDLDGTDIYGSNKNNKLRITPRYNSNIIGYMAIDSFGLDNPRLHSCLTISGKYNGNGFYVRKDNFIEKLPIFAASRYPDHCNNWKVMSMIMKSADKSVQYESDVKDGTLDVFLFQTLLWTCMSHYPHMRSLNGSDGRLYKNQLCIDGDTLAKKKLDEFIDKGYVLLKEEKNLIDKTNEILEFIKAECDEYNSDFSYGLYQIDKEINIKIKIGVKSDGSDKMDFKYGDLNNMIKDAKTLAKNYYINNLVDKLFEYEFLK